MEKSNKSIWLYKKIDVEGVDQQQMCNKEQQQQQHKIDKE